MLPLMGIIQEYLLYQDAQDFESWRIVSYLACFDEFEMYQTD
jgi:hypothetical protein